MKLIRMSGIMTKHEDKTETYKYKIKVRKKGSSRPMEDKYALIKNTFHSDKYGCGHLSMTAR